MVTFGFHWGNVFKSPNWAEQIFYEDCGDITYSPDCGGDCGNIDGRYHNFMQAFIQFLSITCFGLKP